MASVIHDTKTGRRMIALVNTNGQRKYVRLGRVTAKQAETAKLFIEDLAACQRSGAAPQNATAEWVGGLGKTMHRRLEKAELVKPRYRPQQQSVTAWVRAYIDGRTDAKPNTRRNFEQTFKSIAAFFGDKRLDEVTEADADAFRIHLAARGLSEGTIRRECKRAKQFFNAAVKAKRIADNPFSGVKCGAYANAERFYFVTAEEAQVVLDACPDAQWRLLFALCRYGGLRCPSEVLRLSWGDVNWSGMKLIVHAAKTAHHDGGGVRVVPIFSELYPYLMDAFQEAEPGTEYVIARYRDGNANLRTQLTRIIKRAGLVPWLKLFQNLRSTRETELAERFPIHVVCKWLGNTTQIASKHYLQVTDEHFRQAVAGASVESASKSAARAHQKAHQHPVAPSCIDERAEGQDERNTTDEAQLCAAAQSIAGRRENTDPLGDTPKGSRTPVSRMRT